MIINAKMANERTQENIIARNEQIDKSFVFTQLLDRTYRVMLEAIAKGLYKCSITVEESGEFSAHELANRLVYYLTEKGYKVDKLSKISNIYLTIHW